MVTRRIEMSDGLWTESFAEVGATLNVLHKLGVTKKELKLIRSDLRFANHVTALLKKEAAVIFDNENILLKAAEQCVNHIDGVYTFFDPGISYMTLCETPKVRTLELFYDRRWSTDEPGEFEEYDWARETADPQMRSIRLPARGSFNKSLENQLLLGQSRDRGVSTLREVAMLHCISGLARAKRPITSRVRCIASTNHGTCVVVDILDEKNSLTIDKLCDDECHPGLGIAFTLED